MQNRTACSEECAIILFCCLFHYLFFVVVLTVDLPLNYSPFVYVLSTIIFKVKLSGYKSSNCVTESMRTITITNPTTSCIKSLHRPSSTTHPPPICIPAKLRDSLDHIHRPLMHRIPLLRIPNPMIDIPQKSIRLLQCAYYWGISLGLLLCTLTATTMIDLHFFLENIFSILLARGRRVHFPDWTP